MTAAAQDILVTGIANLVAPLIVLISMGKQHVRRMVQIVAGVIAAKTLPMTLITFLFFRIRHIPVFNRPPEVRMRIRRRSRNHWRLNQHLIPPPDNGHGMAQIALNADNLYFGPTLIYTGMFAIMAAETAQKRSSLSYFEDPLLSSLSP